MRKTMTKLASSLAIAGIVAVSLTACGADAETKLCDSTKAAIKDAGVTSSPETLAGDPDKMKSLGDNFVKIASDNSSASTAPGLKAMGEMFQLTAEMSTATKAGDMTKATELSTKITTLTTASKADQQTLNDKCKIPTS